MVVEPQFEAFGAVQKKFHGAGDLDVNCALGVDDFAGGEVCVGE